MQLAAIEFARNVCGLENATSREFIGEAKVSEFKKGGHIIIDSMIEQRGVVDKGGTMRLGSFACQLSPKSLVQKIYKTKNIKERHRHRFEFNNQYLEMFNRKGLKAVGINKERNLVEILENENHPWFIGVQFHPEFKSKPLNPHPLFSAFVKASSQSKKK